MKQRKPDKEILLSYWILNDFFETITNFVVSGEFYFSTLNYKRSIYIIGKKSIF